MQLMETWLVILFLSRKKFHAKQIFMLSSSMRVGPGLMNDFVLSSGNGFPGGSTVPPLIPPHHGSTPSGGRSSFYH